MKRYRSHLQKQSNRPSTPQLRAMLEVIAASSEGRAPSDEALSVLRLAFLQILGEGVDANRALGLARGRGRPPDEGIAPAIVVSAFVELRRRQHERAGSSNAITAAQIEAQSAFVAFPGQADPLRAIERYWSEGKAHVASLDIEDLGLLLQIHEVPDK